MKKLNVICIKDVVSPDGKVLQYKGTVQRVPAILAERLINDGTHEFTTKGKLKSYLRTLIRLHKNHAVFNNPKFQVGKDFKYADSPTVYREVATKIKWGTVGRHIRVSQF